MEEKKEIPQSWWMGPPSMHFPRYGPVSGCCKDFEALFIFKCSSLGRRRFTSVCSCVWGLRRRGVGGGVCATAFPRDLSEVGYPFLFFKCTVMCLMLWHKNRFVRWDKQCVKQFGKHYRLSCSWWVEGRRAFICCFCSSVSTERVCKRLQGHIGKWTFSGCSFLRAQTIKSSSYCLLRTLAVFLPASSKGR